MPNNLSISESMTHTDLAELARRGGFARPDLVNLCYSIWLCILKHPLGRKSNIVFLKVQNTVAYVVDIVTEAEPVIKQIFMYQGPSTTVCSTGKVIYC